MITLPRVLVLYILAAMGLSSCGAATDDPVATNNLPDAFSNFTVLGKSTKMLDTPDGNVEVYDPLQDPLIRENFSTVYNGEASDEERVNIELLFAHVHKIQINDLLRAGCNDPVTQFCWVDYETTIPNDCEDKSWGSATLNACETKHSKITPYDRIPAREGFCDITDSGQRVLNAGFNQIGLNKTYLPTEEASFQNHFVAECKMSKGN